MTETASLQHGIHWQTARQLLASALQVEPPQLDAEAAIGRTERWDSLAHMRLVLVLEEHLGRTLTTEEMLALESLADIAAFLDGAP
ncbi:MAG: acyl carrier protein [Alphaproteobacteria bacterium]|nr:MAG: acyl carrier protein [Alphaproteobacteria bacterium]